MRLKSSVAIVDPENKTNHATESDGTREKQERTRKPENRHQDDADDNHDSHRMAGD